MITTRINDFANQMWKNKMPRTEVLALHKNAFSGADIKEALEIAIKNKDECTITRAFYIAFVLELFDSTFQDVLTRLLMENWHRSHEDIASLFQREINDDKTSINVLVAALNNVPEYLQEETFRQPYIRKLIYAIGAQPEPYNLDTLAELSNDNDETISSLAVHQLEKRKSSGR